MKAFVQRSFGAADKLQLSDVDQPVPGAGEVLVRVRATSVNPHDWHLMRGEPRVARLMMGGIGLLRPKRSILGADIAGTVEALGAGVTEFSPGDEVYAFLNSSGGFAEYVCVKADVLAPKPRNLSFEEAAAVPLAGCTAMLALRDDGRVQPGQRVLVNGASGGVGTFTVQLARAYGAEVTGVCGTWNVDLIRSIGAHHVIDYTAQNFTRQRRRYDVLIDIAGSQPLAATRAALVRKGIHVIIGGRGGRWVQPVGRVMGAMVTGAFSSRRVRLTDLTTSTKTKENLLELTALIEKGAVTPVISRRYAFADIPAAVAYQEEGHAPGKVVISH
jgi:NADPH:quinone reductase-like Zn-dependent oxidoreductase